MCVCVCDYQIRIKFMYRNLTSKFICRSRNPNESIALYAGSNLFFTPQISKMRADESFSEGTERLALDCITWTNRRMD